MTSLDVLKREVAIVADLLSVLVDQRGQLKRGEGADSWLERADRALYQAKANGRNQLVIAP